MHRLTRAGQFGHSSTMPSPKTSPSKESREFGNEAQFVLELFFETALKVSNGDEEEELIVIPKLGRTKLAPKALVKKPPVVLVKQQPAIKTTKERVKRAPKALSSATMTTRSKTK